MIAKLLRKDIDEGVGGPCDYESAFMDLDLDDRLT